MKGWRKPFVAGLAFLTSGVEECADYLSIMPETYQLTKHVISNTALNGKPKLHGGDLSIAHAILMHGGTSSGSSEGCIIFGMPAGWGELKNSAHVWNAILKPWLEACNWNAQINIGY